ncbi:RNA polymerase alpha subunit C-terminal domain-containing protein [uncultured Fluviicola sp.]|uniref:RNA polymerase alpha subunit C-terminal domain-containing protein n=1 Tax=uncultured Fluviicola sp. TaxID=463303 RepID=UPI0025F68B44|nr:RNA polymerase alpha subunit C-terminal domain-containing protein [uncultured Fluviicola sp.]
MSQKTERICKRGHRYFKSSDCPTCPVCEEERKAEAGIFAVLAAPARRAMASHGINTLEQLANYKEKEILQFHGIGKTSIPALKNLLAERGLSFKA